MNELPKEAAGLASFAVPSMLITKYFMGNKSSDSHDQDPSSDNRKTWRQLGLFSMIVTDLVTYSGAGIGLGYLAWRKLGAPWWVLLLMSVAGLGVAFYKIYLVSQKEL